jgi:hypothetical protein
LSIISLASRRKSVHLPYLPISTRLSSPSNHGLWWRQFFPRCSWLCGFSFRILCLVNRCRGDSSRRLMVHRKSFIPCFLIGQCSSCVPCCSRIILLIKLTSLRQLTLVKRVDNGHIPDSLHLTCLSSSTRTAIFEMQSVSYVIPLDHLTRESQAEGCLGSTSRFKMKGWWR